MEGLLVLYTRHKKKYIYIKMSNLFCTTLTNYKIKLQHQSNLLTGFHKIMKKCSIFQKCYLPKKIKMGIFIIPQMSHIHHIMVFFSHENKDFYFILFFRKRKRESNIHICNVMGICSTPTNCKSLWTSFKLDQFTLEQICKPLYSLFFTSISL